LSIRANRQSITATGIKPLTSLFKESYRSERTTGPAQRSSNRHGSSFTGQKEEGTKMKKLGFATVIASGLTAAVLGLAGPAQADIGHRDWVYDIHPTATVPHVDTSVQQSR
jgi:hypothetical protein